MFSDSSGQSFQQDREAASEAHKLVGESIALRAFEMGYSDVAGAGISVMSQITPDLVARMFPGAPRGNIERYLPLIRKALVERGLVDKMMVLMALATIRVETSRFDPISEAPSALNTQSPGPPFNKYDWRQDLGNLGPPDGAMFKGRGFIQLTGRKNYGFYGTLLGHNLTVNPELANTPQPAAQILAAYLKENEAAIRIALAAGDLATARRIINGGLNGLGQFTTAFMIGNQLIRDYKGEFVLSTKWPGLRERLMVEDVSASAFLMPRPPQELVTFRFPT
ncbi:MAG: glycoside hydrolase family 19 protein [Blastocatellales bacterium]